MFPSAPRPRSRSDSALAVLAVGDPRQVELLARLEQDRRTLIRMGRELRQPLSTLVTVQRLVLLARRSVRWLTLAGTLAAITASLRRRRRPPLLLLVGAALQILQLRPQQAPPRGRTTAPH